MKAVQFNISLISAICLVLVASSCKKEDALTPSEFNELYKLPQGDQPYDQEIVEFYKKYNTVILYKFSMVDFAYSPLGAQPPHTTFSPVEPGQVQESLDFLNQQWFNTYPEVFLKKNLPFKILLASDIYRDIPSGTGENIGKSWPPAISGFNHVTFGRGGRITGMTEIQKDSVRGELNHGFWYLAALNGQLDLPPLFKSSAPDYSAIPSNQYHQYGAFRVIKSGTMTVNDDLAAFIRIITSTSYATLSTTLFTPARDPKGLYKKRYNYIVDYYLATYGFDLKAIGEM
jgi:hypothetical protein